MLASNIFDLSLPLTDPVLKFLLILLLILLVPILLNKLRIPHLLGLIVSGAIIGPNGLNLISRDSSIILFGTVGLLYIMFMAGLEIDMAEFKKNTKKSLIFGSYTFLIPMAFGTALGIYVLHYSVSSSLLLGSLFASHTLIAYPIVSKLGIAKNRAVNISVGGTLIADTLALLVLAGVAGMYTGEIDNFYWVKLGVSISIFAAIVMLLFPIFGRWFFKRFDDNISQYIFVLIMVFFGAFLAEVAGVEPIIGAFLAGLALNRLIPQTSPLMNRVEFVGSALFIPFFLIGVGMLIDYRVFFQGFDTIYVAVLMIAAATLAKYIASWLAQKSFKFTKDERLLIFGLTNARVAATLAVVLVGYDIILNADAVEAAKAAGEVLAPDRLLNDNVLNGTILMILVTCTIASFAAQKAGKNIALADENVDTSESEEVDEQILIPINFPGTVEELINLGVTVKSKNNKKGIFALNVINNNTFDKTAYRRAKKVLNKAAEIAAATDDEINQLVRYDINIVNGITSVVKENKITDLIIGLHTKKGITDSFLGKLTEGILTKCNTTTLIYKPSQPFSTIKRHLVIVPDKAEKEIGFAFWLIKVWNIAKNTGAKVVFYGTNQTLSYIKTVQEEHPMDSSFVEFNDWNNFLFLCKEVKPDDNLFIVLSRKDWPSYQANMVRVPTYLNSFFAENSFILIYPRQAGVADQHHYDLTNPSFLEPIEKLDVIGKTIAGLFKRKE